jgi:hypothetical protein
MLPLVLFARLGGFPRRPLAVFLAAAGAWIAAKLLPILLRHFDAVMLGRLLDIGEGKLPILVRHANRLVETRDRVPDVARIGEGLFALLRKGVVSMSFVYARSHFPPFRSAYSQHSPLVKSAQVGPANLQTVNASSSVSDSMEQPRFFEVSGEKVVNGLCWTPSILPRGLFAGA